MRTLSVISMLVIFTGCISSQNMKTYYAYEDNGKYGYKDKKGEIVIPAQYDYSITEEFNGDIAFVTKGKDILAIDRKGTTLLICYNYDNGPDPVAEGLFRFVENDKIGFADEKGKKIILAQFQFVRPFKDGMAAFHKNFTIEKNGEYTLMKGGQWGFINKKGEIVIPAEYVEAEDFEDGIATVIKNNKEYRLDKNGKSIGTNTQKPE
jgi:hypothetical protein